MIWLVFAVVVVAMLAIDLGVFHRAAHTIRFREALAWSLVWFTLAFLFMWLVYFWRGPEPAFSFMAGYLVEWSLSVDNIFVFLVIFTYFGVAPAYQHKVLFWGIVGAVLLRALLIGTGLFLIERIHWMVYLFGAFLVLTGIRIGARPEPQLDPSRNRVLRLLRRLIPVTPAYEGSRFFVRRPSGWAATPLFVVLVVVETTDVVFAVDSVPAVLAITTDPFVVYTSNVFAILGLRALYFAVAGLVDLFRYLRFGLAAILVFVGAKMLLGDVVEIPVSLSLVVVGGILLLAIAASLFGSRGQGGS